MDPDPSLKWTKFFNSQNRPEGENLPKVPLRDLLCVEEERLDLAPYRSQTADTPVPSLWEMKSFVVRRTCHVP